MEARLLTDSATRQYMLHVLKDDQRSEGARGLTSHTPVLRRGVAAASRQVTAVHHFETNSGCDPHKSPPYCEVGFWYQTGQPVGDPHAKGRLSEEAACQGATVTEHGTVLTRRARPTRESCSSDMASSLRELNKLGRMGRSYLVWVPSVGAPSVGGRLIAPGDGTPGVSLGG